MFLNIYQVECHCIILMCEDYINNGGVALIEWANIILEDLPKEYIRIEFKYTTKEDERLVDIRYIGNKEKEAKFNADFGN